MQVAIDIDEEDYRAISINKGVPYHLSPSIGNAILNGTVLPENHGRLLILNEERVNANSIKLGDWSCQKWISEVGISNSTVAIISATKESEESE